jgi:hypothetical protein
MKIELPCVAVYAVKSNIDSELHYGMEVNVVEYFPKRKSYDIEREGQYYYVDPTELYFPQLNTYNQECFN